MFFVHRRFIDKGCRDSRINQSRLIPSEKNDRVAENFESVGIGTYLLPCGLQTIMDFSLTTLPVETALIFWTFWTWAMDCMLYIFICLMECIYGDYCAVLSPFGKVFFAFSIFSDACSSFLRSRLVQLLFLFSQEKREPNRRRRAQPSPTLLHHDSLSKGDTRNKLKTNTTSTTRQTTQKERYH
mgnify:CR=1 FL=1